MIYEVLYERLPFAKVFSCALDRIGCSSISGLLAAAYSLPAPMKSADSHLIPSMGFMPWNLIRFSKSRSDLFVITR